MQTYFEKFEQDSTFGGKYRWRCWSNGRIVADSGEGYRNAEDRDRGMQIVIGTNSLTPIVDSSSPTNRLAQGLLDTSATNALTKPATYGIGLKIPVTKKY